MKRDPPMWREADLECVNISVDGPHQTTLNMNKPIGVSYNMIENPYYENLKKKNTDTMIVLKKIELNCFYLRFRKLRLK